MELQEKGKNAYGSRYENEERESFLDGKERNPVVLAPSWESRNDGKDELNFRNTADTPVPPKDYVPRDRFNAVYLILLLHGIGVLMPWNMFITAHSYFVDYKLNATTGEAERDIRVDEYKKNFLSYLGVAAQVPNVICNALNLFVQTGGGSLTLRITLSIVIEVLVFIFTITLAMIDSTSWPEIFFFATMVSVIVLNMANGVYQNCVYGTAAALPMKYTNAVVLGSNISGTLTSIINIISIIASPNPKTAAIYYFLVALLVLLACFDTYFALPLCRFFRHYQKVDEPEGAAKGGVKRRPPYWDVFKKSWPQFLNVFMVFFVTLAIFPAVHANIAPSSDSFFLRGKYFSPVTCFFVFNFFAMLGNLIPNWFPRPGPKYLWIPVFLRILLIPFFLFCNYNASSRKWPVYIDNDYVYIMGGIVLGLSSGHLSSLSMMYASKCVEPGFAVTAGMMAAFFLILGIFSGINFSFALSSVVDMDLF